MITLDTNVLLRLFVEDDSTQIAEVKLFLEETRGLTPLYIPITTLAEFVWMLGRHRYTRDDIVVAIEFLTDSPDFVISQREAVVQALHWYRTGKADFADYLIHAEGLANGANELVTFDTAFAREDKRRKRPRAWK